MNTTRTMYTARLGEDATVSLVFRRFRRSAAGFKKDTSGLWNTVIEANAGIPRDHRFPPTKTC
ncbi:hypothetical protein ACR8AL_00335 [Clavibacter sepedonicus]|uniref:hypothetical protein n=1 Tax=Clavibacter TaxID=1573 RepID=UPI0002F7844F|nr:MULTISPECIES: hypothetical protein [Clavibacter]MBD5382084.1 hypothetical protein [Clavibacter sp.]OQJ48110.1 hypothetical protein B5P19_07295 [Clavibacter sepedonicus]OQJ54645.1 hypothetical protein B5P20_11485 [Clavibacter sepedonicus]UUK66225.1 hypothetical protein LRE50_03085 [Clavibacter sepedonicus]